MACHRWLLPTDCLCQGSDRLLQPQPLRLHTMGDSVYCKIVLYNLLRVIKSYFIILETGTCQPTNITNSTILPRCTAGAIHLSSIGVDRVDYLLKMNYYECWSYSAVPARNALFWSLPDSQNSEEKQIFISLVVKKLSSLIIWEGK